MFDSGVAGRNRDGCKLQQVGDVTWANFNGRTPPLKKLHSGFASQCANIVLDFQPTPFAQPDDGCRVFFQVFGESLFTRFAFVRRAWIGIKKMGVDLKWNQPQRLKRRRLNNWHIVGRADGGTGHIGACRTAHIRSVVFQSGLSQGADQLEVVQCFEQTKRVPASNEHGLGLSNRFDRIGCLVNRVNVDVDRPQGFRDDTVISFVIGQRVGDKQQAIGGDMRLDIAEAMLKKSTAMDSGTADQEEVSHHGKFLVFLGIGV